MNTALSDRYQGVALGVECAWPEHIERLLDDALEATFPASDPVAVSVQ